MTLQEKMFEKCGDYKTHWPEAVFAPWDPPPIGMRVKRGDLTGTVVGSETRELLPERVHFECKTCTCPNPNSLLGWWHIELDRYKDERGKPHVSIEYPPGWHPIG